VANNNSKLTTTHKIAILAIAIPAVIAIIGGTIKYLWPKDVNGSRTTQVSSGNGQNIGVGKIEGPVTFTQIQQTDSAEFKELKQRVAELEKAIIDKFPPVKTQEDAHKTLTAEEKSEYERLIAELEQQKELAQKKFKKSIEISLDAQLSHAGALLRMAQYSNAESAYRTILSGHPDNTNAMNGLGIVLYQMAKYKEAEELFNNALSKDEQSFRPNHPNVAIRLNNLAALYKATNRLKEAEPLMKRALALDEASFGKDHPKVARDLNNLAALYQATNRLKEAEPLMKRALAIDEASFGKNHPWVATALNNLALVYQATNRLKEAEPLMQRALKIFENSLGPDHPSTITVRDNLETLK